MVHLSSISILKTAVILVALVQGSSVPMQGIAVTLENRVQSASSEAFNSLKDLAIRGHDFERGRFERGQVGYFLRNSSGFSWFDTMSPPPAHFIKCMKTYASPYGEKDALLFADDQSLLEDKQLTCSLLDKEIIRAHAVVATEGKLSEENPYSTHLVYTSDENGIISAADLGWVSKLPEKQRAELAEAPITICPFVSFQKTRLSVAYRVLSATIFGTIPKKIEDICMKLLGCISSGKNYKSKLSNDGECPMI